MSKGKEKINNFYWKIATKQLDGIGVIEIILILVIIIGLVLIFRNQIEALMKVAFQSIRDDAGNIGVDINVDK